MKIGILSILLLGALSSNAQNCDCDSVFSSIYAKWDRVETVSYHSFKNERQGDEYFKAEFDFVVQRSPFKVAGVMVDKGHRLLYDQTLNAEDAIYIPNGFPYKNLSLDVHGSLFRGMNHYTISNAGSAFIFGIMRNEYQKMKQNFVCSFYLNEGNKEVKIYAETDSFQLVDYQAQESETVLSIADKFKVMAYLILEYNDLDGYTDNLDGKVVKVPSHYGKKVTLRVDAEHGMPTYVEVVDPKGLVEIYKYTNYKFGLDLPLEYFTEDYLDSLD